jgi:hypothetical protein
VDDEWKWVMTSIIRLLIASHPDSTVADLNRLAGDEDEAVRLAVAENPNTPTNTLLLLTEDENIRVAQVARQSLKNRPQSTVTWLMGNGLV